MGARAMNGARANAYRGEVEIEIGGATRVLRPTFAALAQLEQATGLSLIELATRAVGRRLGIGHVAWIVWAGLRGAQDDAAPDIEIVGEWVVEEGYSTILGAGGEDSPLAEFMALALGGREKKAPAPVTRKPTPATIGPGSSE